MKKALIILLSAVILQPLLHAQKEDPRTIFLDGEYFMMYEEYADALPFYLQLADIYPNNANINYRIGVCFLNLPGMKQRSIPYLERAVKNTTFNYREGNFSEQRAPLDAYYFLGTAYRINREYEKACEVYTTYRQSLNQKDSINLQFVDQQIRACMNAMDMDKYPVFFERVNLGETINNEFKNFNPLVANDENTLIFVTGLKFYDAIFEVSKTDGKWGEPVNLTPQIKSDGDLYPTGLTPDGKTLFLSRDEDFNADIFVSTKDGTEWTPAVKLGKNINTKYWESHASVSPDGKSLYFVSNQPGGFGGFDIYVSEWNESLQDWDVARNLGPVVNTRFNEESPFIARDGKTLYFSSQGHQNFGGYDMFSSILGQDGNWSKPVNLGYPLNMTDDDMFFYPLEPGITGYQAIYDGEGYGHFDIYRLEIFSDRNPRKVRVHGAVTLKDKPGEPGIPVEISIGEPGGTYSSLTTGDAGGNYSYVNTVPGTYSFQAQAEGYNPAKKEFNLPSDYSVAEITLNAILTPIPKEYIYLKTVYFNFDRYNIERREAEKLNILANILAENPSLVIEANGHTDSKGTDSYNQKLSQRRAASVITYLIGKGIDASRLKIAALGEKFPVAINQSPDGTDSPDGRKYNRRVEMIVIRSENPLIRTEKIEVPDDLKLR